MSKLSEQQRRMLQDVYRRDVFKRLFCRIWSNGFTSVAIILIVAVALVDALTMVKLVVTTFGIVAIFEGMRATRIVRKHERANHILRELRK